MSKTITLAYIFCSIAWVVAGIWKHDFFLITNGIVILCAFLGGVFVGSRNN